MERKEEKESRTKDEMMEQLKVRKYFELATRVSQALASENVTREEFMCSLPVLLNFLYGDKKDIIAKLHTVEKLAVNLHEIIHEDK